MFRMKKGDEWKELIDVDLPDTPIDELTKEVTRRESFRFRGGVRISLGKFWTDKEYEKYREKVLNTPLP